MDCRDHPLKTPQMRELRPKEGSQLILINGKGELKPSLLTPKLNVVYTILVIV